MLYGKDGVVDMTTFQMECFLALANSLSFTQAAAALYITQPNLSRTIAAVERELGATLLIRSTHSVMLTPAGKVFADECRQIMALYYSGVSKVTAVQKGLQGEIRLGYQRDIFEPMTVRIANTFQARYPKIRLDLVALNPTDLIAAFDSKRVDAVVAQGSSKCPTKGEIVLSSVPECVIMASEHPLAGRESVSMEELEFEQFIVRSRSTSTAAYNAVIERAARAGFTPDIKAFVDDLPSLLMMVAANQGISVMHQDLEENYHQWLRFVPLVGAPNYTIRLFWDRETSNQCVRCLVDLVESMHREEELSADV